MLFDLMHEFIIYRWLFDEHGIKLLEFVPILDFMTI